MHPFGNRQMSKKELTEQEKADFQKDRWSMQNHAAKLLKTHRISYCLRSPISKKESIKVVERTSHNDGGDKRYGFTGLQCCGNVHGCPMCSSRISLQRENEVRAASDWAKSQGYLVAMLTLTHPHSKFDMLKSQLDALLGYTENGKRVRGAMYHFRNSKAFRGLDLVGDIKKFEVTHGDNGWHPHHHIMLILDPKTCGVIDERKLYNAWANACEKAGLERPSFRRGLRLDYAQNDSDISGYISKMGSWDMAQEMTKDQAKQSKKDGKTQWQLLRASKDGDKLAGSLFVEYVDSTKGVKSLAFSRGLKKLVGLDDVSDQVLADDVESVESVVFEFVKMWLNFGSKNEVGSYQADGLKLWHLVLHKGSRYKLLEVARKGGRAACYQYLIKLVIDGNIFKGEDFPCMQPVDIRPDS